MYARSQDVGELEKPSDNPAAWAATADDLHWFTTDEATRFVQSKQGKIPETDIVAVFAVAKAIAINRAFIFRGVGGTGATQFLGYENKVDRTPGTVLLDATSDIDGVTPLCPWRQMQPVPQARYDNLSIVHIPSITRERLTSYFTTPSNRRTYVEHMSDVIRDQMEPGQRGLVVCKKTLIVNELPSPVISDNF